MNLGLLSVICLLVFQVLTNDENAVHSNPPHLILLPAEWLVSVNLSWLSF